MERSVFEAICDEIGVVDTPKAQVAKDRLFKKLTSEGMSEDDLRAHLRNQKIEWDLSSWIFNESSPPLK